jgi:hypothetical protein
MELLHELKTLKASLLVGCTTGLFKATNTLTNLSPVKSDTV